MFKHQILFPAVLLILFLVFFESETVNFDFLNLNNGKQEKVH